MKSKERVQKYYKPGTKDWEAQYDMLLDDGVTCKECFHIKRCSTLFGQKSEETSCQFYPNVFTKEKQEE